MAWPWDVLLAPIQMDQGTWTVVVRQGIRSHYRSSEESGPSLRGISQDGAKVIARFLETVCNKEFETRQEALRAADEIERHGRGIA